jgi:hypothetical protein
LNLRIERRLRVIRAAFNPGSMSTISAARDHLANVLRSTVNQAPKSTARLWTRLALAGRHRNHTFGGAP